MQESQSFYPSQPVPPPTGKSKTAERVVLGCLGILLLCNLIYISIPVIVDIFGTRTPAKLITEDYPCNRNRTCQRGHVEFQTSKGTKSIYSVGYFPLLMHSFFPVGDDDSYQVREIEVSYFDAGYFSIFTKLVLPYHLEYLDPDNSQTICGALKLWVPLILIFWFMRRSKKIGTIFKINNPFPPSSPPSN